MVKNSTSCVNESFFSISIYLNTTFSGLIFDWIANLLGWIQAQSNIISYSINSGTTETIYSNLHKLTSLTVDAQNGLVTGFDLTKLSGF